METLLDQLQPGLQASDRYLHGFREKPPSALSDGDYYAITAARGMSLSSTTVNFMCISKLPPRKLRSIVVDKEQFVVVLVEERKGNFAGEYQYLMSWFVSDHDRFFKKNRRQRDGLHNDRVRDRRRP